MRLLPRNRTLYAIIGFYEDSTTDVVRYKVQYTKLAIGNGLITFKLFGPKMVDTWLATFIRDDENDRTVIFNTVEEAKAAIAAHRAMIKEERLREKRTEIIYLDFVDEN